MSDAPDGPSERSSAPARSLQLRALAGILFLEAAALAAGALFLVVEVLTAPADSIVSAIALAVLVAGGAVWVALTAVNTLRGRSWIRGSALTFQVLQIAIAVGSFQGIFARPDIGWALLVPAFLVIGLLFTRPVLEATARREE